MPALGGNPTLWVLEYSLPPSSRAKLVRPQSFVLRAI